eukprot:contig_10199_g2434
MATNSLYALTLVHQHGDRARSLPLTRPLANSKAGKFKSKAMILLQSFVYKACGAGFPGGNVDELYSVFLAWQPNCSCDNDQYETLRAHKLYPIRVKVLNALTVEEQWYTVAYVPQVPTEKGPCGAERSRLRRMAVLQRVLYLTFQSLVNVSHSGVPFAAGELGELRAFPRILLYMCDQPEERAVLCLKSGMCQMPCSSCDVHVADMATETALKARSREPLITVLDLGVTLLLVQRLVRVFPSMYAPGDDENRAAFTGREQRRGVRILPFLFAGLFDCGAP